MVTVGVVCKRYDGSGINQAEMAGSLSVVRVDKVAHTEKKKSGSISNQIRTLDPQLQLIVVEQVRWFFGPSKVGSCALGL
jgi:hypothetical protein